MNSPVNAQAVQKKFDLALEHHQGGRLLEAKVLYEQILAIDKRHSDSLHLLGMVSYAMGDCGRAVELIESAIKIRGDVHLYLGNLGNVLRKQGRLDEAIMRYRQAIAVSPQYHVPYSNLGNALRDQGKLEEAIAQYKQALAISPDFYEALFNLANTLKSQGDYEQALAYVRQATRRHPNAPEAHYVLGQILLTQGELEAGWPEYDWRWKLDEYSWLREAHGEFTQSLWNGESLSGKTLLVYAEQGMGDAIQFVRYLPQVVEEKGARVIFAVHPRIRRLIGSIDGVTITALDKHFPPFDVHCPLLSLPRIMGTRRVEDIPAKTPYIQTESALVAKWRDELAKYQGFKVGIAWQGNPQAKIDQGRSLPLAAMAPLAKVPGVRLISLQQRDGLDQLDNLPDGMVVERLSSSVDVADGFIDTAAIMQSLDLIIVSDSAITHLAGALARPVWVPLKKYPDWRFLQGRADCPWYPTMRLFRQRVDGDWDEVFKDMAAMLGQLVGGEFSERASVSVSPEPTFEAFDRNEQVNSMNDKISILDRQSAQTPLVPVSWGEIIDKITILEIKAERLSDAGKLANVRRELAELAAVRERHFPGHAALLALSQKMKKVNEALWHIEDDIRDCERAKDFGARFIELARAVYVTNDHRSVVKREVNDLLGSALVEEKSYAAYSDDQKQTTDHILKQSLSSPSAHKRDFTRLDGFLNAHSRVANVDVTTEPHRSIATQIVERLIAEGVVRAGQRALDVGCGQGGALEVMQAKGLAAVGLAMDADADICRAKGLDVRAMDQSFIEFSAGEFDFLWSRHVLQSSILPFFTLSEYKRVVKLGGHVYIETPAPDTVVQHQSAACNRSVLGQSMWLELFRRVGLTMVWAVEYNYGTPTGKDSYWAFLLRS